MSAIAKQLIFNDKENTGQSSPTSGTGKRVRRPLRELTRSDMTSRDSVFEFTVRLIVRLLFTPLRVFVAVRGVNQGS